MEASYLKRILIHLQDGDPDVRVLKTYLDSWYAHSRGGAMLEPNGRPRWMNRGDLERKPELCDQAHAISEVADAERLAGRHGSFVRDHTIPKQQLIAEMYAREFRSTEELESFLRLWFTVTIITQAEHARIGHRKLPQLTDEMLVDDPHARFLRYSNAGLSYRLLPPAYEAWF